MPFLRFSTSPAPRAIEERRLAARREKPRVSPDAAPFLRVASPSGFAYRAHLRGDVPVRQRPVLIRSFTERKGSAVLVSTDAGGRLNLQAADVVVNLDLPWNPARRLRPGGDPLGPERRALRLGGGAFNECPKARPEWRVPGCGATLFLRRIEGFRLHREALLPARIVVLFEREDV